MQDGLTALYRYFDDKDRLLYVGISGALATREKTHIETSRWMELTARSEIARYPSRNEALKAEREAIETEQPLFNKQYNDTPEARAQLSAYLREIGRVEWDVPRWPVPGTPAIEAPGRPALAPLVDLIGLFPRVVAIVDGLMMATMHVADRQNELISRVEELERRLNVAAGQGPTYEQLTLDGKGHLHLPAEDEVA